MIGAAEVGCTESTTHVGLERPVISLAISLA